MKDNTPKENLIDDNHVDDHVDEEIRECFSLENPKNFFVFAGAGSGKTRSLINTLTYLDMEMGDNLSVSGKKIAVITYTNAACDEISRRLQYKPIFTISTIHSFLWELIRNHQSDIREWIVQSLEAEIEELEDKLAKGRGRNSAEKRAQDIKKKTERLTKIVSIKKFTYNPNGDNIGYDSLSHNEVIKMSTEFIANEPTMQNILTSKFPIILIDESQDTKKELVDALLIVCEKYKKNFIVGMFGDTMQKIYTDGKENLAKCIPEDWIKPKKVMNHRSAKRIVDLANSIRSTVDAQKQRSRSDAAEGMVRLFIAQPTADKEKIEKEATEIMAKDTNDNNWVNSSGYKSLILEHHMAANRLGFCDLYMPLNDSKKFDTSLKDGSIPELSLLATVVAPLVLAYKNNDDFEVARIVRSNSPLLNKDAFAENLSSQILLLQTAEQAVDSLMKLWENENVPTCIEVLKSIRNTGLLKFGNRIDDILSESIEDEDIRITALRNALSVPFDELERYYSYVTDSTRFATHQGVKGLEFPRVMVIMDDTQARGFLFSYEKLFGAKSKTDTDLKNEREGKDTSLTRTARLFYVACTRAQESLAVVAYSENIYSVKNTALSNGWFHEEEIYLFNEKTIKFEKLNEMSDERKAKLATTKQNELLKL